MPNFRPTDRLTGFLMPPSVDEWLPQTHLARFVVEVVDGLDLSSNEQELSWVGFGLLPPESAVEPAGVWLRRSDPGHPLEEGTRGKKSSRRSAFMRHPIR